MIVITHLSSFKSLDKVSGAKEMTTSEEQASTSHIVLQLTEGVKARIRSYEMRPLRRIFNFFLIEEEPPNTPPPERDKLLISYTTKDNNFLCIGACFTLTKFEINSYTSRTNPTIISTHEGVLTALRKPYTHSDLIRIEAPTPNSPYTPSLEVDRLIGAACEAQMRTNNKHRVAKESSIIFYTQIGSFKLQIVPISVRS
ncbi:unnamed protein product [Cochlearia groenlandica]